MKTVKKSRNGEAIKEYFTEVDDPSVINFKVSKVFTANDLEPVFGKEFGIPFDFNSMYPLWRAVLLKEIHSAEQSAYKNALVFTLHHVIADGRSILVMLNQFLRYVALLYEGQEIMVESMPFRPSTAGLMRHCCTPSLLDKVVFRMTSRVSRSRASLLRSSEPENLYLANHPPIFNGDSTAPNKTSIVYREVPFDETLGILNASKMAKCSVHGSITAAAHMAMAKILQVGKVAKGSLSLKSSCNVDLRKECRPEIKSDEFVLCVSSFRTEIKVPPVDSDFWAFAQKCMRKLQRAFYTGQHRKFLKQCHLKLAALEQQTVAPLPQQDQRVFNLSNMGRVKSAEGPYHAAELVSSVTLQPKGPVFAVLCVTIDGAMHWTVSYNIGVVSREQATEFLDLTLTILRKACSVPRTC